VAIKDSTHVDYVQLRNNIKQMIAIQEYDGMRSPGKVKMNSANLVDMYTLLDRYDSIIAEQAKTKPTKKVEEK
jgi:hypothetical protein